MRTRRRPMIELYGQAFLIGAIGTPIWIKNRARV
jgi:hypothetical protein